VRFRRRTLLYARANLAECQSRGGRWVQITLGPKESSPKERAPLHRVNAPTTTDDEATGMEATGRDVSRGQAEAEAAEEAGKEVGEEVGEEGGPEGGGEAAAHAILRPDGWSAWQPITMAGYEPSSGDVYFFSAQVNPVDTSAPTCTCPAHPNPQHTPHSAPPQLHILRSSRQYPTVERSAAAPCAWHTPPLLYICYAMRR